MAIKIVTSSIARLCKIYRNWDFWFENIPSGNTDLHNPGPNPTTSKFAATTPAL
jgi:hypothetical protein